MAQDASWGIRSDELQTQVAFGTQNEMIIRSLLFLFLPFLSGLLFVHLIWDDKDVKSLLFKVFLGIGVGLGLNSLFYFIYLLLTLPQSGYLAIQILALIILLVIIFFREKKTINALKGIIPPNFTQAIFLIITGGVIAFALIIFFKISASRTYGALDAWAMYNRTARFIFRGGAHWMNAFSPELPWYFHADYPPLIALNIASGWNAIGEETIRIPMVVGGAFLFGCAGLLFTSINMYQTVGQASLAICTLFGISGYLHTGALQISDIPLSFFILATGALVNIYSVKKQKNLIILAGLSAGLSAWTKNEGVAFALASFLAILFVYRNNFKNTLSWYLVGLIFPITVVIFFKTSLAPSNDIFVNFSSHLLQIMDPSRHREILLSFLRSINTWGNWGLFLIYVFLFGTKIKKETIPAIHAIFIMLFVQAAGYYVTFLLTPHSLEWHLHALSRVLLQIAPLFLFLYFSIAQSPESIFKLNNQKM